MLLLPRLCRFRVAPCALLALMLSVVAFDRLAAEEWTVRNAAQPGGKLLWGLTDGAAGLVAVGYGGRILHSDNGRTWTRVDSGTTAWLVAATYGNGRYMAVGEAGNILSSIDGRVWTRVEKPATTARLNNILYAQDKFVAVGERGTIVVSPDGVEWSATVSNVTGWLHGLAYGGGYWISVGENGAITTSSNGADWTVQMSPTKSHLEAVAYGSSLRHQWGPDSEQVYSRFVAVGHDGVALTCEFNRSRHSGNSYESFWAAQQWQGTGTRVRLGSLAVYDNFFIATGDNGTVLTAQGVQGPWTAVDVGSTHLLNATGFARNSLFLAGEGELIMQSRPLYPSRLGNISTRGRVGTGADVLIAGTYVSGELPKQFLIRGVGPTLANFELNGVLSEPILTVYDSQHKIVATNSGWEKNASPAAIAEAARRAGAFELPAGNKDAALVVTLDPGLYTFVLNGASQGTGLALIEAFDLDTLTATSSRAVNISTRGVVGANEQVLIAGLVVQGPSAKTLVVRGVGPTLQDSFNLPGVLEDPVLTVYGVHGNVIATNDDWEVASTVFGQEVSPEEVQAAAAASGAFPLTEGSKDSALVLSLAPGNYTIHISGKNNTTGVALVEVYEVPTE